MRAGGGFGALARLSRAAALGAGVERPGLRRRDGS